MKSFVPNEYRLEFGGALFNNFDGHGGLKEGIGLSDNCFVKERRAVKIKGHPAVFLSIQPTKVNSPSETATILSIRFLQRDAA